MQQTMNKFMQQANGLMQTKMSKCMRLLGLLMLFLFVGIGNAWAQEVTLDFSETAWNFPSTATTSETSYTNGDYTISASTGAKKQGSALLIGKTGATLTLPRFDFDVARISFGAVSGSSSKVTFNIYVDETAVSTECTATTSAHDFDIATGYQEAGTTYVVKITNNNNAQFGTIKIYKASGASATYTLTYDGNKPNVASGEVTNLPEAEADITVGEEKTLSTQEPILDGYTFVGWGTTATATETVSAVTVNANTTVYAIWQENVAVGTTTLEFDFSSLDRLYTDAACTTKASSGNANTITTFYYRERAESPVYAFAMTSANNGNSYFIADNSIISAFFGRHGAHMDIPQVAGKKITKIVTTASASCSNSAKVAITDTEGNDVCSEATWGNNVVTTYDIPAVYQTVQLCLKQTASDKNVQVNKIKYYLAEDTETPLISVSDFDLGSVEVNGSLSNTLTVTGSNLTEIITYSLAEGASSAFTVTGELTATGGTLNVALKSAATKGIFSDQLTLTSGETTKTITLTAKVTGAYSVAEALTEIDNLSDGGSTAETYKVEGYIKQITYNYSESNGVSFLLVDNMGDANAVTVYKAKEGDASTVHAGDKVRVEGKLMKYKSGSNITPEITNGNITLLEAVQFTISATSANETMGSVSGAGAYGYNASVTLTAAANEGYEFVNWKEDGVVVEGADAEFTFNATADRTLVAYFQVEGASTVVISASADYAYRGSVSGADSYAVGTDATLTATPKTGYQFVNWTENGEEVSTAAEYTFNVANVRTLVANFAVKEYITVAEAIEIAKATPLSTDAFTIKGYVKAVNNNKQITLTDDMNAEPEQETFWAYNNSGWGANATQVGDYVQIEEATLTTYNNTPESTGGTLTVLSSPEYTVTVDVVENGFISLIVNEEDIESGASVIRGKEVKLVIMPDVDYRLQDGSLVVYKSGDNSTTVTVNDNKFAMPMYDVRIYAAFEQIPNDENLRFHIPAGASIVKGESLYDEENKVLAAPAGDNVVLPTATVPAGNEDWVFYGWATAEQTTQTNILPANVVKASELYTLNETAELYALYVHISDKGYCKVTENRGDWSGQYLIVRENEAMAFNGSLTSSTSTKLSDTNNAIGIALSNDKADLAAETAIESLDDISFKIAAYDGGWSIKSASGYYIGYASSSSTPKADIKVNETTQYKNTIEISENEHIALINSTVTNSNSIAFALEYNNSSSCFRYYAGTMAAIHLYRKSVKETFAFTPGEIVPVQYGVYYYEGATPATEVTNMPEDNPVSVNEGETYTITSTIPVREGYTFLGWKLDGTETIYHAGDEITIDENDIEFYAQWRSENVIVFDFTDANELTAWGLAIPETGNGTNLTDGTVLSINFCSLTYAKGGASTDTRIWATKDGLELRTYAGSTLTVSLPAHYAVETIEVDGVVKEDAEHNPMLEIEGANKIKTVTVSYTKDAAAPAVPDINVPTNGITNLTCNANTITVQAEGVLSVTNNVTVNEFVLQANGANKPEVVLNGDVIVVGNVYLEWELKLDEDYPFTLPCDVEWSGIEYWNGSDWDANFYIQVAEYDGAKRAAYGTTNGSNWRYVIATENDGKLLAHKGYIMKVASSDNSITGPNVRVRFPLNALKVANKLTEDAGIAVSENSSDDVTNAGWNYVGNPFLHSYQGTYGGQNYIAITNDGGHTFTTKLSDGQTVTPFSPFFVQVASGEALNFATPAASMPELRTAVEYNTRLFAELTLDADQMGIWMSDRYTTAYEINADFGKIFGSDQATAIYTVTGGNRLAYNALPDAAAQAIPVGFSATAGEHTIALREGEGFAHLYLTDKLMNTVTDLLTEDYTFTTEGDNMNESRFELNAVRAEAGTPTGVAETVSHEGIHKVLLNGKVYIVREGVWYDVMGKIVK